MSPRKTSKSKKNNNRATLGIEAELWQPADSFHNDLRPDLKTDYILAISLFKVSDRNLMGKRMVSGFKLSGEKYAVS